MQDHTKWIGSLQDLLEKEASQDTKQWWEKYMKGVIPYRGVGIPAIRNLIAKWLSVWEIENLSKEEQLEIALALFQEPIAEDKLAGILFLQYYLYDQLNWNILLERYENLYQNELIFDWNTCDWFCVRVLSPTILKSGLSCAKAISLWSKSENLWQARSSVVAFVKAVSDDNYYPYINESCKILITRQERFAKTSVGWILRDISKYNQDFVEYFLENHIQHFSRESLKNAIKYFSKHEQEKYLKLFRK